MFEEEESLRDILIRRDGETFESANDRIREARARVADGENPEEVLEEEFGLEPDWIFELL